MSKGHASTFLGPIQKEGWGEGRNLCMLLYR